MATKNNDKPSFSLDEQYKVFIKKLLIITLFLIAALFIYNVKNILIALGFAVFLNILFSPLLNRFNKWKIPDILGLVIIYILAFLFVLLVIFAILPIFVNQFAEGVHMVQNYISNTLTTYNTQGLDGFAIPEFLKVFISDIDLTVILNSIKENIGEISAFVSKNFKAFLSSGVGIISSLTSMIANFFLVFVFTFFIGLERENIKDFFYRVIPTKSSAYIRSKEPQIVAAISDWFKTQAILGVCIFVFTLIGLNVIKIFGIHMDNIFTLSLIAGLMEFVPYIGPVLSAVPAIVIALGISTKAAIVIVILYVIIQQFENNVLVPFIMGKSLSLSPFAVLIGMTIGASLFGIVGIIIAIPAVAIIQIFMKDYLNRSERKEAKPIEEAPKEIIKVKSKSKK